MVWLTKADALVPAVSAASVVAKVHRDEFMREQAANYAGYGFETNMGYGTKRHMHGLRTRGVCPLHRRSYRPVKPFLVG
jgi:ribonuclease HII